VGDNEAAAVVRLQEVFEQDLGAQVQEIWSARRAASRFGSCSNRAASFTRSASRRTACRWPVEVRALQLELAGHLTALPVGLVAIAHRKSRADSPG